MKAYKGFNRDMTCRGFQYEEGKEYKTNKARCCATGFHACEYPLDCLSYYEPCGSVFHEVELDGDIDRSDDDTKVAATKIKIGARLSIAGLVKAAIEYTMSRIKPEAKADENYGAASATGYRGAASATGDSGAASATGYRGAASATGYRGAASATGYSGAASATGDSGAASATGDSGAASATGDRGAASATGDRGAASATGYSGAASATGYSGAASATGYSGAASATGDSGAASATGYRGAASATGDSGAASATGDSGAASATGYSGAASAGNSTAVAIAWGPFGKAQGIVGSHIVLADWQQDDNFNWRLRGAKMVRIDGKKYKADTWYGMRGGKIVEVA